MQIVLVSNGFLGCINSTMFVCVSVRECACVCVRVLCKRVNPSAKYHGCGYNITRCTGLRGMHATTEHTLQCAWLNAYPVAFKAQRIVQIVNFKLAMLSHFLSKFLPSDTVFDMDTRFFNSKNILKNDLV